MQMCVWGCTGQHRDTAHVLPSHCSGQQQRTQAGSATVGLRAGAQGPMSPLQQCQRGLTARPGLCPGSRAGSAAPAEASTAPAGLLTASKLSLWKLACVFLHYRAAAKARLQCRHTLYLSDPKCNFI